MWLRRTLLFAIVLTSAATGCRQASSDPPAASGPCGVVVGVDEEPIVGDFALSSRSPFGDVPGSVASDVASLDVVEVAARFGLESVQLDDDAVVTLLVVEPAALLPMIGDPELRASISGLDERSVIVDGEVAAEREIEVGDAVSTLTESGAQEQREVSAVVQNDVFGSSWLIARERPESEPDIFVLGCFVEGVGDDVGERALAEALAELPDVNVQLRSDLGLPPR